MEIGSGFSGDSHMGGCWSVLGIEHPPKKVFLIGFWGKKTTLNKNTNILLLLVT